MVNLFSVGVRYAFVVLDGYTVIGGGDMATSARQAKPAVRQEMSGVERLGLRVSSMINSPRAMERCSALIHRLDSDQDADWDEVMGRIAETDGVNMIFQDDGGVLLEWEPLSEEDRVLETGEVEQIEDLAPF
ncbi:DUF1654 domain-containing protein [Pseudomonas sp. NPDC087626]|uniref:DUF1654 domain-containing protein n=1 Tax=Pseudomonas sp. NPDC087626 TaxID=3364444 RepID=UPI00380EE31F